MMSLLRCRSCNVDFHDNASLEVHYQYAHSNGGESLSSSDTSRPSTEPDVESAASAESAAANDTNATNAAAYFKFHSPPDRPANPSDDAAIMTAISPGNVSEGRDFHVSQQSLAAHQHHLQQQQQQQQQQQHHQLHLHHQQTQSQQRHQHLQLLHLQQQQAQSQQQLQLQQQQSPTSSQRDLMYDVPTSVAAVAPPPPPPLPAPLGHPATTYDISGVNSHHHHAHHNHNQHQQEFARSSQNAAAAYGVYGGDHHPHPHPRYHPYYKTAAAAPSSAFGELQTSVTGGRGLLPAQGLLRCDKCDYQTVHSEHLVHHLNVAHADGGPLNLNLNMQPPPFGARFGNGPLLNGGAEPQAEILDLDSHKVHVYQPPNGEDSADEEHRDVDPWLRHHHHRQQQHQHQQQQPATALASAAAHQRQNGGTPDPRGTTPLPSPDFGSVSTTSDHVESSTRSPYYEHGAPANAHISSTENANGGNCAVSTGGGGGGGGGRASKGGKSTNGAWKSNEARRPKTYNCSACNKWFTSSGHLKRHYNTTLHKNAVKQSGAPDPATLPVSHHHHPQKDPTYATPSRPHPKGAGSAVAAASTTPVEPAESGLDVANVKLEPGAFGGHTSSPHVSTTMSSQQQQQQLQQQPTTPTHQSSSNGGGAFHQQRRHSPNLIAGPSEHLGGLSQLQHHQLNQHQRNQHPSYPMHQSPADLIRSPSPNTIGLQQQQQQLPPPHPPHSSHLAFPPQPPPVFGPTPTMAPSHSMQFFPHMSTKVYPNFQSPHVSTTHRVTTTSSLLTGSNLTEVPECADSKLPSFACLPKNTWNQAACLDHVLGGTLETSTPGQSNVGGRFTTTRAERDAMLQPKTTTTATATTSLHNPFDRLRIKEEPSESASSDNDDNANANANKNALPSHNQSQVGRRHRQQSSRTPPPQSSSSEEESVTSSTNPVLERLRFKGAGYHHQHQRRHLQHRPEEEEAEDEVDEGGAVYSPAGQRVVAVGAAVADDAVVEQPFSCDSCQKRFNKACYLTQHNKSFHSGLKPFKCSRCGKRFLDSEQYSAHLAKHSGDKPYKCDVCPKAFNHKTDLRRHACLHSDTRPFHCDLCGKGFIRKDHMLKHRETHKNRKNGAAGSVGCRPRALLPAKGGRLKRSKALH